MDSRNKLISAFQNGDRVAFEKLVVEFQNLVTSIAYANTRDLQSSEDIAQQAFLIAWEKKKELRQPNRFAAWLTGITRNLARNNFRRKTNRTNFDGSDHLVDDRASRYDSPAALAIREEQSELLWKTLDKIPVLYREAMILFYREERSISDVAQKLGLSEDTVKQRLKRGREKLKQHVELMVEEFLTETRPSSQFSSTVIAALPMIGAKSASLVVKAGAASSPKWPKQLVRGKRNKWTLASALWLAASSLGFLTGVGVGWMKTRIAASRATSDEERVLLWNSFHQLLMLAAAAVGLWSLIRFNLGDHVSGNGFLDALWSLPEHLSNGRAKTAVSF